MSPSTFTTVSGLPVGTLGGNESSRLLTAEEQPSETKQRCKRNVTVKNDLAGHVMMSPYCENQHQRRTYGSTRCTLSVKEIMIVYQSRWNSRSYSGQVEKSNFQKKTFNSCIFLMFTENTLDEMNSFATVLWSHCKLM